MLLLRAIYTQFQIRVHKPYHILDQNGQNLNPISDQNGSKTIPFGAVHTLCTTYIGEYPQVLYNWIFLSFLPHRCYMKSDLTWKILDTELPLI